MTNLEPDIVNRVMALPGRTTRAIVDLDAIAGNVRAVSALVGPDRPIRAVVKADGYGHGAIMVARAALDAGAESLAVATVGEAAALRSAGITASILLLGPIDASEVDRAIELGAEITVGDVSFARLLNARAAALGVVAQVHIKVDTGMHRFGMSPDEIPAALGCVDSAKNLSLVGFETHHASSDDPGSLVAEQQSHDFEVLISALNLAARPGIDLDHANSGAGMTNRVPRVGSVRLGIGLYGLQPGPSVPLLPGMRPAMSLFSRLVRVHTAPQGSGVSYGHTYHTDSAERLGLVPIGYADGYRRSLSNTAWVLAGGKRLPIRGRVCMDQIIVGDLDDHSVGDLVSLGGAMGGGPSFDQIANWAGTINYEVATSIGPRVPRYYVQGGDIVATLIEGQLTRF